MRKGIPPEEEIKKGDIRQGQEKVGRPGSRSESNSWKRKTLYRNGG